MSSYHYKSYVINASSATHRWQCVSAQLDYLNMPVERIEAIMGKDLSPAELSGWYSPRKNAKNHHKPLLPAEIGCYASHIRAWRKMLSEQLDWALILEDDAIISPEINAVIEAVNASVDFNTVDMIKLRGTSGESRGRVWSLHSGHDLVAYQRIPSCTTGYILTANGARKLLAHNPPVGAPVDIDICNWWKLDLRVLGVLPYSVKSNDEHESTIGSRPNKGFKQQVKRLWQHNMQKIQRRNALQHQAWLDDVLR